MFIHPHIKPIGTTETPNHIIWRKEISATSNINASMKLSLNTHLLKAETPVEVSVLRGTIISSD